MATIKIPPVLRGSVGGEKEVEASGSDVGEVLRSLASQHPETESQLFSEDGELNRYVNVYLNDEDVRVLNGLDTSVSDSRHGRDPAGDGRRQPLIVRRARAEDKASWTGIWLDSAYAGFGPLLPEGHEYPAAPPGLWEQLLADPDVSVLVADEEAGCSATWAAARTATPTRRLRRARCGACSWPRARGAAGWAGR